MSAANSIGNLNLRAVLDGTELFELQDASSALSFRTTLDDIATFIGGNVLPDLPDGTIWIGDATNTAISNSLSGDVTMTNTGVVTIASNAITNLKVSPTAAINFSKMEALGLNFALVSDGSGVVSVSAVTATELGFVSGVTSAIQTQLNGKEPSLGFTPEDVSNKVTTIGTPGDDTNYPTEKAARDALDLKEDSLGFTPENAANKGAVSGYAGLDASQELLLTNFPSGTALQLLRRNAGNTALEFHTIVSADISDFQTTVSANSDVTANTAKVTNATHTGDATGDVALTIASDAVTYAKMQNVVADDVLLGNIAGAGGIVTELTGLQVNTILPNFTDTLDGLTPLSGGGTTNFLRADGTWVAPPGGGANSLNDLTDVTITIAAATQILIYNTGATAMENQTMGGDATLAANGTLTISSDFAKSSDNLSFFDSTTSLQLLGVISDETGSGLLVFGTSPTIVTPTIASFTNATHSHLNATGGGTITAAAISDFSTAVAATASVTANTAKVTNANHTGDVTGDTALTIANNAVTLAKIQDIATSSFLGRITAATGDTEVLTGTQATTILNVFTSSLQGLVPSSGGGTTNFLRADGTFAAPAGDMVLADVQTVTGAKTFGTIGGAVGKFILAGSTSGSTIFNAAAVAGTTTITLPGTSGTVVITGLASQITIGTEVTGASTALTDTASIAYLNTDNTFLTNTKQTFTHQASKAGIALAAVAGDVTSPNNGEFWYDATSNKFRARENSATVDMIGGGGSQTPWTSNIDADGFDLVDLSNIEFRGTTGEPAGSVHFIANSFTNIKINVPTGDLHLLTYDGVAVHRFSETNYITNNADVVVGTGIVQFFVGGQDISGDAGGVTFKVPTSDNFDFQVNSVSVIDLDVTNGLRVLSNRFQGAKGADVASATTITLGNDGNLFDITGTTQIDAMTSTNWQAGSTIVLHFDASVTVRHNIGSDGFFLSGAADFSATADDTLTIIWNGTRWEELSRSIN